MAIRPLFVTLLLLPLALAPGCATSQEASPLIKRAVFELECPREKLKWQKFDEETYGVRGCGKQATYVYVCQGTGISESCTWLRNH
jgi:hypothetical protein